MRRDGPVSAGEAAARLYLAVAVSMILAGRVDPQVCGSYHPDRTTTGVIRSGGDLEADISYADRADHSWGYQGS